MIIMNYFPFSSLCLQFSLSSSGLKRCPVSDVRCPPATEIFVVQQSGFVAESVPIIVAVG